MYARYKFMCGCECWISAKIINSSLLSWHDWYSKKLNIKVSMLRIESLVKNKIAYMKHIKIQSFHMGVIFLIKHLIWQRLHCVHILSLIMHWHTENVYWDAVLMVHVSIFMNNKKIIRIQTQHHQYGFTFITSFCVVLLMVEFHWKTKKHVSF